MPRGLTQYGVFIASPSGLDEERKRFRTKLEKFSETHSEPHGIVFKPVGWETTVGGVGRPQELINEDLRQCDYAVFVLHDRWGSPPGGVYRSGFEEEWALAEELYRTGTIRNIALFFRTVEPHQMADPGPQLTPVIEFKARIEGEKRYLFKQYDTIDQFAETIEEHLATWLRRLQGTASGLSAGGLGANVTATPAAPAKTVPSFNYWLAEALRLSEPEGVDHPGVLFCATKAIAAATSDIDWARAANIAAIALFHLGKLDEVISTLDGMIDRLTPLAGLEPRRWLATALFNKAVTLGQLGRSEDEIAVYDDLLTRFALAAELPLREHVASTMLNKGATLSELGRREDAIAVYDDLLAHFAGATELRLREQVASALFNKGLALDQLERGEDAIAVYDDLLAHFAGATELHLRQEVAKALFNKGVSLGQLERGEDEIKVYDDLLARFGAATELPLREQVAKALVNKSVTLGRLGQGEVAIATLDDLLARFTTATELPLRELVATGLFNKGVTLGHLGRGEEEIAAYDDLLSRFAVATELPLREQAAKALIAKGITLGQLGHGEDAIAVLDDLLARFAMATEAPLRDLVARAKRLRASLRKPRSRKPSPTAMTPQPPV